MQMIGQTQRNLSLDILRIMACLGVISIHSWGAAIVHDMVELGSLGYFECLIMDALSRWSVPVFAMLTGFFLLDPMKDIPLKKLFLKYLARIVVALAFWAVFYAVTLHSAIYPFGPQGAHFWYLGMLIGLYLSLPILRIIACHPSVLQYYCIAWALYLCYVFLGNFIVLPFQIQEVVFLRYSGYCLVAFYLKINCSDPEKNKCFATIIYILGFIGLLITIVAPVLVKSVNTCWWLYDAPNVSATAIALFLFFVRHPLSFSCRVSSLIELCAKCTFGIYLIHMWVIIQLFFRLHRFFPNPIPLNILCVSAAFFLSFFVTWLIKKIPYLGRYIV